MSQFGSSTPADSVQRAGVRAASPGGFTDTIQVVNTPALAAGTGNLVALDQIDRILGISQSFLGAVNTTISQKASKVKENNAHVDMLDRALANRHAREDAVSLGQLIDNGTLKVPDGVSLTDFANQVVTDELASQKNPSEAYTVEYKDLAPVIAEKLAAKQKRDKTQAVADNMDLMVDRAFAAKSPDDVKQAIAFSVSSFGVTERQAQASITIPAMKQAAAAGDSAKVNMLAASLPDGAFAGDVAQLRMAADAAANHQQTKQWAKADDTVQSLLDANVSTAQVRDSVDELYQSGQLAPGRADYWRKVMDTRDAQAQNVAKNAMVDTIASMQLHGASDQQIAAKISQLEQIDPSAALEAQRRAEEAKARVMRQQVELERSMFKQGVVTEGVTAAAAGFLGSARDVQMKASDGKTEFSMSAKEIQQASLDAAFAQIDQEELKRSGGNYIAAFPAAQARKVRLVGQNGVLPESFRQTLETGAAAANPQLLLESKPPPATLAAYSLYRQLLADAPAVAERAASGVTKELFDNAAVLQSDFRTKDGGDDIAGALAAAARNVYADPMGKAGSMERLKAADVQLAAKSLVGRSYGQALANIVSFGSFGRPAKDVKNMPEVEAAIRTRAAAYLPTKSPEDAIRIASERVGQQGQVIDGWWTRLSGDIGQRTRSALGEVVASKADQWTAANPNSGVSRDSIRVTMEPSGRFVLIDNTTGFPLSPPVTLTAAQIDDAFSATRQQKANDTILRQPKIDQSIVDKATATPVRRVGRNTLE